MKRILVLTYIGLLLAACKPNSISKVKTEKHIITIEDSFDSCMTIYAQENPYIKDFPVTNRSYHTAYSLYRRLYKPDFYNLTIDLWNYVGISETVGSSVFHIYNDSIQLILPFTDVFYLRRKAYNDTFNIQPYLTLGKELNRFFSILHIPDERELGRVLTQLMEAVRFHKVGNEFEFSIYKQVATYFKKTDHASPCHLEIDDAIERVKNEYNIPDKYIYTNGVIVYIFTIKNMQVASAEILASTCIFSW